MARKQERSFDDFMKRVMNPVVVERSRADDWWESLDPKTRAYVHGYAEDTALRVANTFQAKPNA